MNKRFYQVAFVLCAIAAVFFINRAFKADIVMAWYGLTDGEPSFKKETVLVLRDETGIEKARFDTEVADDEAARELGLMFRRTMADRQAMLFIFEEEQPRAFWMKNTRMPLDIIYFSADSTVVSIKPAATLFSTKPVFSEKPARYVLEVKLGVAKEIGLKPGDRFRLIK
jgi:uncharacterized membrane protein (UPF0127 family)